MSFIVASCRACFQLLKRSDTGETSHRSRSPRSARFLARNLAWIWRDRADDKLDKPQGPRWPLPAQSADQLANASVPRPAPSPRQTFHARSSAARSFPPFFFFFLFSPQRLRSGKANHHRLSMKTQSTLCGSMRCREKRANIKCQAVYLFSCRVRAINSRRFGDLVDLIRKRWGFNRK